MYICGVKKGVKSIDRQQCSVNRLTMEETLERWWGFSEFRPMQREIIGSVLAGRDTLALMPTGGGKSLTYQLPAMMLDGVTIVVTPLIALMKDQVDRLRSRGIPAVAVHSGMDNHRIEVALDNCTYGDTKLLYIAPERLATEAFRIRLRMMRVAMIAVDEAHCISQWGYDFRPSYLRISELREFVPDAPILALTASATMAVANDIMHQLGFKSPNIMRTSFARPNLSYSVRECEDKYAQVVRVLDNVPGTGIIYVRTREWAERLSEQLAKDGYSVKFYHAGLPTMERALRQDEWQSGRVRIIVATNAFGMGIDKADVRFVIHYMLSDSLEAYYQEAGRAGRDGERSYALMLYSKEDANVIELQQRSEFPPIADIKTIYDQVCNHIQVAIGDGERAAYKFNVYEFCFNTHRSLQQVVGALKILEQNNVMTLLEEHDNPARLMFMCSRDALYRLNADNNDMDLVLRTILRSYNGVFNYFCAINEDEIAAIAHLSRERVHEILKVLWNMRIIRYIPASRSPMIYLNVERLPKADVYIAPESYNMRYEVRRERFKAMLDYVAEGTECRSVVIQRYFGDEAKEPCGVCDNCLRRRREGRERSSQLKQQAELEERVLQLLGREELTVKELVARLKGNPETLVEMIDKMLREGKIYATIGGKLKIK